MRVSPALLACLGVLVALALRASPSQASPQDEARAEKLFDEGQHLFEAHRLEAAAAALTESEQLDPQLGTLINLALCDEGVGRPATAMRQFEIAAAWAAQRHQPDRETFARQHAADLAKRTSAVQLQIPEGSGSYAVSIDGEAVATGRLAMPLFLDPGLHAVHVSAPGMLDADLGVHVEPGPSMQTLALPSLMLAPIETKAPPVAAPVQEEKSSVQRPLGLVASGVGIVALSLAGYLVARDGRVSPEAVAAGAAGGIALGGGAFLWFSGGPVAAKPAGGQCATVGVGARF